MQSDIAQRRIELLASHINAPEGFVESVECVASPGAENADFDIIIVGAGVVGCAAAVAFGKQGRKVLLCERDLREPDRIVGELMQPGGVDQLRKIGIAHTLENIDGVQAKGYAVFSKGVPVHLPYPGVNRGCSFHHGRFIMSLRKAAAETPKYASGACHLHVVHVVQC